jgi:hypothetical protein
MFDITNSKDFYEKLVYDEDLHKQPDSGRMAMNCAITAYHLAEWVWGDWLKSSNARRDLGFKSVDDFKNWLDGELWGFAAVQSVTNGTKHFIRNEFIKTQKFERRSSDRGSAFFLIEIDVGPDRVQNDLETVIEQQILFWRDFFRKYSPYGELILPPSGVLDFS